MGLFDFLIFSALLATSLAGKDFVPVLMWGAQMDPDPRSYVSGLSKLDTEDFYNYLLKRVKVERPTVAVFVEENLSLEDFSWKDINEQGAFPLLSNLTKSVDDVSFLPSVHDPYSAISKLQEHGYSWQDYSSENLQNVQDEDSTVLVVKLTEPDTLEGRPDLLRSHDREIAKTYNDISSYTSNVIAIYTGNHSSWIDADVKFNRVKRNEIEESDVEEDTASDSIILTDNNKTVLILIRNPLVFQNGTQVLNLSETTIKPTVEKMKESVALDVNFKHKSEKIVTRPEIDFHFGGSETGNWRLSHIIVNEKKEQKLLPSMAIEAPRGYSFTCGRKLSFADKKNQVFLEMNNFQLQPYVKDGKFGPAIDCVPYFSIAIWSGLFIVFLLLLVLAWGILMIMDINTMDRFDDPKGKTITISATD